MQILLIDDDQAVLTSVAPVLADEGYEVLTATNAKDALITLKSLNDPALVLVDMYMPRMSGYRFLKSVAHDPRLATQHAYALVTAGAHSAKESLDEVLAILNAPVLLKPYNLDELHETLALLNTRLTLTNLSWLAKLIPMTPTNAFA